MVVRSVFPFILFLPVTSVSFETCWKCKLAVPTHCLLIQKVWGKVRQCVSAWWAVQLRVVKLDLTPSFSGSVFCYSGLSSISQIPLQEKLLSDKCVPTSGWDVYLLCVPSFSYWTLEDCPLSWEMGCIKLHSSSHILVCRPLGVHLPSDPGLGIMIHFGQWDSN